MVQVHLPGKVFQVYLGGDPGDTQERLERLNILAGLATIQDPPRGANGSGQGEEGLGFPIEAAAPATWTQIRGIRQDEMRTILSRG